MNALQITHKEKTMGEFAPALNRALKELRDIQQEGSRLRGLGNHEAGINEVRERVLGLASEIDIVLRLKELEKDKDHSSPSSTKALRKDRSRR